MRGIFFSKHTAANDHKRMTGKRKAKNRSRDKRNQKKINRGLQFSSSSTSTVNDSHSEDLEGEEEASLEIKFQSPGKTSTPTSKMEINQDLMKIMDELLTKKMNELQANLKREMMDSEKRLKDEVFQRIGQVEHKNEEIEKEIEVLHQQAKRDRERIEELEKRWEGLDRKERKNNIIISGHESNLDGRELAREIEDLLKMKTEENVEVIEARRWKTKTNRTIIWAKMKEFDQKIKVMKNKRRISNMVNGSVRPVYVADDLTREEREMSFKARVCRGECIKNYGMAELKYERGRPVIRSKGRTWRWNEKSRDYNEQEGR